MIGRVLASILKTIRPVLGPASCRFYPSCTEYACEQLQTKSLFSALKNIIKRLRLCF